VGTSQWESGEVGREPCGENNGSGRVGVEGGVCEVAKGISLGIRGREGTYGW
jgi:hypothetical protein